MSANEAVTNTVDQSNTLTEDTVTSASTVLLRCRRCGKPNVLTSRHCSGCDDALHANDVVTVEANPFASIIAGNTNDVRPIHYRDDHLVIFDDAYGMSAVHLIVVPVRAIRDITKLTADDAPLLMRMGERADEQLKRRVNGAVDFAVFGFNFPVSVAHLHLHAALPPFKHRRVCEIDRWYALNHVVDELKHFGRVRLYSEWDDESMPMRMCAHASAVAHALLSDV